MTHYFPKYFFFPFKGHFAYFRPLISDKRGTAQLQSEMMAAVDHACLEMWHYAQGWGTGEIFQLYQYLAVM